MKKSVMYSLHGFIWFCDLCIIFLATLAGKLWINELFLTSIVVVLGLLLWSMAIFYLGYSWIAPRFLSKHKYLASAASLFGISLIFPLMANADKVISAIAGNGWMGYSLSGYVQVIILSLIICTSGILLRIFIDWVDTQQKKKELESEKLNSKLMVLINQNNPHFIFNVLNNIDSLITSKPAKASEMIAKLSGLLRYIYANSDKDNVSLHSEIDYIENYIVLQALRQNSNTNVKLKRDIHNEQVKVVPMLFLPFVENAFKHGLVNEHHPIDISISSDKGKIVFDCRNHCNVSMVDNTESGFGISNIIKRLDLMYPTKYKLNIENSNNIYSVSLTLTIDED